MSEYERSIVVEAAPETVFDFVSNAQNSAMLLPPFSQTETGALTAPPGSDRWTRVYPGEYLMEWGSDGEYSYSGWLQIEEMDDEFSEVILHYSYPSRLDMNAASIQQDLLSAIQLIKEQIERRSLDSHSLSL